VFHLSICGFKDACVITSISITTVLTQPDVDCGLFLSKNPILPVAGTYVEESGGFNHSREVLRILHCLQNDIGNFEPRVAQANFVTMVASLLTTSINEQVIPYHKASHSAWST
jgi:hypothetical protein